MRYTHLFGKTQKLAPKDASFISHKLLYQAGFIRESTAGRYYFLPLGIRVHDKIKKIIKEEMDKTGAQEMVTPVLHPKSLWEETNRTNSVGFELMSVTDRGKTDFVLGGTAEEMLVDLVRKFQLSYKDLPFNLYQFSTKFRDEMRARGGLLRVREFTMKDAYSFDRNAEEFKKTYETMAQTYTAIFTRLGLTTIKVAADNGYIGGEYCHEYQVESPIGEGKYFISEDGAYIAHEDIAGFVRDEKNLAEEIAEYKEIDAVRGNTMEDGVKLHNLPMWRQMKDVMYVNDRGQFILAVLRGDLSVNEIKLQRVTNSYSLRPATAEEIRALGSEPGFISPVGLAKKVRIIGDISLNTVKNMYGGANKKYRDAVNMNKGRDYTVEVEADIAMCEDGFRHTTGSVLREKRGIEVGNIFQLGYHYTKQMAGATFAESDGTQKPYYMGCYGIGLGRTLAAIVEIFHDEKGIMWPKAVAPFQVHLIVLGHDQAVRTRAENIYHELQKEGIEILYDDRDTGAGEKFADCDLIGIPVRIVVSEKTGEKLEWKNRTAKETTLLSFADVLTKIKTE